MMFRNEWETIRLLSHHLTNSRPMLAKVIFLGLAASAFEGVGIYLFLPLLGSLGGGGLSDSALGGWSALLDGFDPEWHVPVLVGLIILCVLLKSLVTYLNSVSFAVADGVVGHRVRGLLFSRLLKASNLFLESQPSGRIPNALLAETWKVNQALNIVFTMIIDTCGLFILIMILLLISWQAAAIVAPFAALIAICIAVLTRHNRSLGVEATQANIAYTKLVWESLLGVKTIQMYGQRERELSRFRAASDMLRKSFLRISVANALIHPLFEFLSVLAVALWIVVLYWRGEGAPTITVLLIILYRLQPKLRSLISCRAELQQLANSVEEVEKVGVESVASTLPSGTVSPVRFNNAITFNAVSFRYPASERLVLDGVDLVIPKNTSLAIVGRSGMGKTTLINLLCRNIDPSAGTIRVDDVPLGDQKLDEWQSAIGLVSQEAFIFDRTVRENIIYGVPDATPEQMIEAAMAAGAHDFISKLPLGYETQMSDRGANLSGGQRQRISLARALAHKAEILILDEATSALDSHTESAVMDALEDLRNKVTLVIVSHRLSTIRGADKIVVIDEGKISEEGTFAELSAQRGMIWAMEILQGAKGRDFKPGDYS